jgi:hypothetical protein
LYPAPSKASATARPIPLPAPVINATLVKLGMEELIPDHTASPRISASRYTKNEVNPQITQISQAR